MPRTQSTFWEDKNDTSKQAFAPEKKTIWFWELVGCLRDLPKTFATFPEQIAALLINFYQIHFCAIHFQKQFEKVEIYQF